MTTTNHTKTAQEPDALSPLVEEILSARKYRELGLPTATVRDLLIQELPRHRSQKDALQSVRRKLHNVVADYLGDPDYPASARLLDAAFASGDPVQVQATCRQLLFAHASTNERLPLLNDFYSRLWQVTGLPHTLLDLACGLHPFGFPWMGLPASTRYFAYDIHRPRVDLLNHFFSLQGLEPLACCQDILVSPPQVEADVAFFFKEAHRFEQRQHGCNRTFWQALKVNWLLVSLPTESMTRRHSLEEGHRRLVENTLAGLDWPVIEVMFPGELVFCIHCGA
jgi:16S rRNA (guanine(1405)-N(7))-methyltransferase